MEKSFLNTERNIALVIIFSIITFGIYGIWYFISFQNDIKDKSGEGFGGWGTFFVCLLTFGFYGIYWNYATGKRLVKAGVTNKTIPFSICFSASLVWGGSTPSSGSLQSTKKPSLAHRSIAHNHLIND